MSETIDPDTYIRLEMGVPSIEVNLLHDIYSIEIRHRRAAGNLTEVCSAVDRDVGG